jgi:preprotein translocase subunit SecG
MLESFALGLHVFASLAIICLVLLQQGKGADVGASFGAGASQTVFGSQGSVTFLSRTTAWMVTIFFCTSLLLVYLDNQVLNRKLEPGISDVPVQTEIPIVSSSD